MKCTFCYTLSYISEGITIERDFWKDSSISFVPDVGMVFTIENVTTSVKSVSWCHDDSNLTIHLAGFSHDTEEAMESNAVAWRSDDWKEE